MNTKIITIFTNIIMLFMCLSLGIVLRYVQSFRTQDNVQDRAYNSVLSVDIIGESDRSEATWSGSSIKSMITESKGIDHQMEGIKQEEPIYKINEAGALYEIRYNGAIVDLDRIDEYINDNTEYRLIYNLKSRPKIINIESL